MRAASKALLAAALACMAGTAGARDYAPYVTVGMADPSAAIEEAVGKAGASGGHAAA